MDNIAPYVLERLDRWYSNRIKKGYTSELERKIIRGVTEDLISTSPQLLVGMIATGSLGKLTREEKFDQAKTYFSDLYEILNRVEELKDNTEIPKAVFNEYFEQTINSLEVGKKFIEKVGEHAQREPLDNFRDGEIDQIFLEVFEGAEGFSNFALGIGNAIFISLELLKIRGKISQERYDLGKGAYEVVRRYMFPIYEAVFGDIKSPTP